MAWSLRRPEADDVPALLEFVGAGFAGYKSFAPPEWEPPAAASRENVERTVSELAVPGTYSIMAEADGEIAGFVHWSEHDPPVDIRFRYLFVAERFWGTGLARALHDPAVAAMGDKTARLFTPEGQNRARRFYERGGWRLEAIRQVSDFGLPLVEYRRGAAG